MFWLDNARIIAIYAVLILHVAAGPLTSNDFGSFAWWVSNVMDSMVRWCVPVFVMISGALLLDPNKQESLSSFYFKRLSKILIPIVFWSILYLGWAIFNGESLSVLGMLKRIVSGKPHYHMWFLYMIVILYLFTPFFRKVVAQSSQSELGVLTAALFVLSALNFAADVFVDGSSRWFFNWFLQYIPYFFLGYYIRNDKRKPAQGLLWLVFLGTGVFTCVGCYLLALETKEAFGYYFYGYVSISVIPMSISLMYLLKSWDKPMINAGFCRKLSLLTLGIYLIHPIFLETLQSSAFHLSDAHPLISIPVLSVVVALVSTLVVYLISHIPLLKRVI
ncbi:acyltransferase [Alteromonas sp. a30]|uniref:acyltransferase n=1 Tax=Alteromonas sp. a30 TaxID=2730917 RepID=UPI002280E058|nr:acyltransferase family protein [Alteromonas sp. a30]MCY7296326.1 acyltransferase family protein [Alteromonas sp. a30]